MQNGYELFDVGSSRLRVRSVGEGPAVVFVHGWTLDLDMWAAQFAALADRYRLIAFDRRGFGLSTGVPGIEHDVADIDHLLGALGVARAAIVGMSQGARVAMRWASTGAPKACCLVLDGPPRDALSSIPSAQAEVPTEHYRDLVRREGIDAFRQQWLKHPFMRLHSNDPQTHTLLQEMVGRYPGHDLSADDTPHPSPAGDLRLLDLPTLVINGAHDTDERLAAGAELTRVLPNARLAIVPDAGHLPSLDNPRAYNRVLDEFFALQTALAAIHEPLQRSTHHAE
jgi:3-oxoadipate enol-lactonase